MDEVLRFLQECKTFYIATTDGDLPKVRPFGFVMEHEGRLYFCTGNFKEVYRQLQTNPNFEICACDTQSRWLRLNGRAVFDSPREVKAKVFALEPGLKAIYPLLST